MDDDAGQSLDALAAKYHRDLRQGRKFTPPPEEDTWPSDQPDWIFLARAIRQLGAHRHGAKWSGEEGRRFSRIAFPRYAESWQPRYREARRQVHRLLLAHSDYIACPVVSEPDVAPSHAFTDYNHSEIMWRRAEEIRLQSIRNGEEGLRRLRSIEIELLGILRNETVRTGLRRKTSTNVSHSPSDLWATGDIVSALTGYEYLSSWIYLHRQDFDSLVRAHARVLPEKEIIQHHRGQAEVKWMISALKQLYPDGDPVKMSGLRRSILLERVKNCAGQQIGSSASLDRARKQAWTLGEET